MNNALYQIADNERRIPRATNALSPRGSSDLLELGVRNALILANAYQVPRDLGANILNALYQAPSQIAGGTAAHLTGEIPLPTGEPGRPFTNDDAYRGGALATNALGSAGLLAGPIGGRAMQGVAASSKQASPFAMLPSAEVKAPAPIVRHNDFERRMSRKAHETQPTAFEAYHGTPDARFIDTNQFKVSQNPHDEYGAGVYVTKDSKHANQYANSPNDEGRGASHAPGVVPVQVSGRFYNPTVKDLRDSNADMSTMHSGQKLAAVAARNGFDGLYDGPNVVVFPDAKGKGVVRSATTGKSLFSDNRGAAPAAGLAALPSAEVRSSPDAMFRPERVRAVQENLPPVTSIDSYHGTPNAQGVVSKGFDPSRNPDDHQPGVFTTTDPRMASEFAGSGPGGGVIATTNKGRYIRSTDDELTKRRLDDLDAAGVDGVHIVRPQHDEIQTFPSRRETIFDRHGNVLFSDNRGAAATSLQDRQPEQTEQFQDVDELIALLEGV